MTELNELLVHIPDGRLLAGSGADQPDPLITDLAYDSRRVQPGSLFFCIRGQKSDGLQFLPDAVAQGAVAAVVEGAPGVLPVPAIHVPNVRAAMAPLSAAFFNFPSRRLQLVGVTGTNGKTTTTYLVEAMARGAGRPSGVIGTTGARINGRAVELAGDRTTPESPDLQRLLAEMAETDSGAGVITSMEVSSHALDLGRTSGCEFDVAVFTNLTQDHLDYHPTMDDYFAAKARLFTEYPRSSSKPFTAVINTDDAYGRRLADMSEGQVLTYGVEQQADYRASEIVARPTTLEYRLTAPDGKFPVRLRIGGGFNIYNSLGAIAAARALEIPWETLLPALAEAAGVPGRFESVPTDAGFSVIVDYAHSPDGVENVLRAARALNPRRLITVFGCGGDRDRTKRPIMGRIAAELSDHVIVTSDNPRTENPDAIIREILTGIPPALTDVVEQEPDRAQAIRRAVQSAKDGDLVVIAGKGHETYQIFAHETVHFDDREEARKAIHARLSS